MSNPPKRRRRWLARLALILAAPLAAVVAVELFADLPMMRAPIWRQIRYSIEEHRPGELQTVAGYRGTQTVGGGVQEIRHDRLGMRGPDHGPKAPDELRLLFLGDSVTYGTGVGEEQAFPAVCAALLRQRLGRPVAAGIAACPGFGTVEQPAFLRRVQPQFGADLIVACVFVENDLYDNLHSGSCVIDGFPLHDPQARWVKSSWRARLMLRSKVAHLVEKFLGEHLPALAIDTAALQPTAAERSRWDGIAADQSVLFLEQAGELAAIERLLAPVRESWRALVEAAGAVPVVVVLIPSYVQYVPGLFAALAAQRPDEREHRLGTIQRRLADLAAELGLAVFDLLPVLARHTDVKTLLIPNDYHFTPAGNRYVAEQLAPWLLERLAGH